MADTRDLLIEIGTEELPPKALAQLAEAFETGLVEGLAKAELAHGPVRRFATPRRLALLVRELPTVQPERRLERRGPALGAAFDADGRPTRATEGFARSCGVAVEALTAQRTDKGAWLVHSSAEPGASAAQLLPGLIEAALAALPVPRRMRWGAGEQEFIHPIH